MLCSPSCGSQNFLRLGAPKNFDRCANTSSLFLPPAAVRPCCPKQARRGCATPRYIQFNILYNLISACSLLALPSFRLRNYTRYFRLCQPLFPSESYLRSIFATTGSQGAPPVCEADRFAAGEEQNRKVLSGSAVPPPDGFFPKAPTPRHL